MSYENSQLFDIANGKTFRFSLMKLNSLIYIQVQLHGYIIKKQITFHDEET